MELDVPIPSKPAEGPGPTVVQVKRKRSDEPFESLWLEVTNKPSKRHALGISKLSLDATTDAADSAPTKLLFRRVESFSSGVKELSLPQLLEKAKERKRPLDAPDSRQIKKIKDPDVARTARFEQVRSLRQKENIQEEDDSGQGLFHLYEVIRVDVEAESAEKAARREKAKREAELKEGQLLCNYLPLLREHLPDLAAEIDAAAASGSTTASSDVPAEEYVYDFYTLDEEPEDADLAGAFYPTIQVFDSYSYDWRELKDSDYDSEDSNDENNPSNDYPEEEDVLSDGGILSDSSGDDLADYDDPYAQGSEEYDTSISDDDKAMIWKLRR